MDELDEVTLLILNGMSCLGVKKADLKNKNVSYLTISRHLMSKLYSIYF